MRNTITREEIRDALSRSGYLLETRVEDLLKRRGYFVQANANFEDRETGKSRELDVHALGVRNCGSHRLDFLWHVLAIECINNPQPIVFFTKKPISALLHRDAVAVTGMPMKVWPKQGAWNESVGLVDYLEVQRWHHYCRGRAASQYCSFTLKKGGSNAEWMALHEGPHYDTIRKLCDAVDYYREEHLDGWRIGGREHVNLQIYYPILVVQGDLLELRSGRSAADVRSIGHAQFRQGASSRGLHRNYQIDVVQERALPRLLRTIEKEVESMRRRLKRRGAIVTRAVDRISVRTRRARSMGSVRKIMEQD
jgi:hypothetical protein